MTPSNKSTSNILTRKQAKALKFCIAIFLIAMVGIFLATEIVGRLTPAIIWCGRCALGFLLICAVLAVVDANLYRKKMSAYLPERYAHQIEWAMQAYARDCHTNDWKMNALMIKVFCVILSVLIFFYEHMFLTLLTGNVIGFYDAMFWILMLIESIINYHLLMSMFVCVVVRKHEQRLVALAASRSVNVQLPGFMNHMPTPEEARAIWDACNARHTQNQ